MNIQILRFESRVRTGLLFAVKKRKRPWRNLEKHNGQSG